jgi:hypothetical protein
MLCLRRRKRLNLGDAMDNPIIIIIVAIVGVVCLVVLFFVVEILSKGNLPKKSASGKVQPALQASEKDAPKDAPEIKASESVGSTLASEIEAMIVGKSSSSQREEKVETASQRSRMHNRRARMLEYYDKKYKSRTVTFAPDSFEEPVDTSAPASFVVDGVEITKEDVRKLTALNDLLKRKSFVEDA